MEIRPTDATLGAVVTDVDLSYLNEATFEEIEAAWHSFAVWIFPGQHLADEAQVAFTKRFGRLEFGLKRTKGAPLAPFSNLNDRGTIVRVSSLQVRF